MILQHPARVLNLARMLSTYVGRNGREYTLKGVLHRNARNPSVNVSLALSDNKPFVLKPVSDSIFGHLDEFKTEFDGNPRLRNHVDQVDRDKIVIYEFFKTDLRSLTEKYPPLPKAIKKAILKEIALVLNDMHEKEWIHLDVKPDNIFIDWDFDSNRQFRLQRVVLGDMDCALKLNGKDLLNFRIGNVRWRSPEGQVGRGVGKPSEVFTFALLCLYTITRVQLFEPTSEELKCKPEIEILIKFLSIFGPLPDEFIRHVETEEAATLLSSLWEGVKGTDNMERLADWSENDIPDLDAGLKRLISRMTSLDPGKRATISDILKDPYWD